jgi:hypothetical protein
MRNGEVTAVVDWECAGWYSEYWEYTKAHYNTVYRPDLHHLLDQKVTQYEEELEAERMLWERYDQFLDTDPVIFIERDVILLSLSLRSLEHILLIL